MSLDTEKQAAGAPKWPKPLGPSDAKVKVLVPEFCVRNIVHISNAHIPTNLHERKSEEYKLVFERLYRTIRSEVDTEGTVIVVTGDLLRAKHIVKAETVRVVRHFLWKLSLIAHTVVAIGNKDLTENGRQWENGIRAITDRSPVWSLHVLKYTGVYQIGSACFAFSSPLDDKFIFRKDISGIGQGVTAVYALFNGAVHERTNSGLGDSIGAKPTVGDFDGYDAVLLGDIHESLGDTESHPYREVDIIGAPPRVGGSNEKVSL